MPYTVTCPTCNEKNIGSSLHCVKCDKDLIGIPRDVEVSLKSEPIMQQEISKAFQDENKPSFRESVPHALFRIFRSSLVISFVAMLVTALICWSLNKRTLYEFGNSLFYTSAALAIIGWYVFNGNQRMARSWKDQLNPMNRVMPGTFSEQVRKKWLDYMDGMTFVSMIGTSAIFCFVISVLIVNLIK